MINKCHNANDASSFYVRLTEKRTDPVSLASSDSFLVLVFDKSVTGGPTERWSLFYYTYTYRLLTLKDWRTPLNKSISEKSLINKKKKFTCFGLYTRKGRAYPWYFHGFKMELYLFKGQGEYAVAASNSNRKGIVEEGGGSDRCR